MATNPRIVELVEKATIKSSAKETTKPFIPEEPGRASHSAVEAYKEHLKAIYKHLHSITKEMNTAKRKNPGHVHGGHVKDVEEIHRQLKHISDRLEMQTKQKVD